MCAKYVKFTVNESHFYLSNGKLSMFFLIYTTENDTKSDPWLQFYVLPFFIQNDQPIEILYLASPLKPCDKLPV